MGTERCERRTFPRSQHRESNNRLHFEALLEESSVRIDHYHLGIFKSSPAGITSFFPSGVSFPRRWDRCNRKSTHVSQGHPRSPDTLPPRRSSHDISRVSSRVGGRLCCSDVRKVLIIRAYNSLATFHQCGNLC